VRRPVALEGLVDAVGQPEQGQLAQGGEVAGPEVVGEGRVDPGRRVDVAVSHPSPQRLRRHVDQLDLVSRPHDVVGHGLALHDAGDRLDDVVQRLEVLDVDRGDDVDAGGEQHLDVLPPLRPGGAGSVGVGQLVDEGDLRAAGEHRVDVELVEGRASVLDRSAWHELETLGLGAGERATVGLQKADDDIGAPVGPSVRLREHGNGLPDARGGAEIDP